MQNPQARTDGMVSRRLDDELIILDSVSNVAHCLSPEAAEVWRLCDGESSPEQIAANAGLSGERLSEVLETLHDADLLEADLPETPRDADAEEYGEDMLGHGSPGKPGALSRREATKRFAQLSAVALGAQLIYSIGVPAAAAAASGIACSEDCASLSTDLCYPYTCDATTGKCVMTPRDCDDNNACTVDTCDPVNGLCRNTPIVCPVSPSPCVFSVCDPVTGCGYANVQDGTSCGVEQACYDGVCIAR